MKTIISYRAEYYILVVDVMSLRKKIIIKLMSKQVIVNFTQLEQKCYHS